MAEKIIGFKIVVEGNSESIKAIADIDKRLIDLKNSTNTLKESTKGNTGAQKASAETLAKLSIETKGLQDQKRKLVQQVSNEVTANNSAKGSYAELVAETARLRTELHNLEGGIDGTSEEFLTLQKTIFDNTAKLKEFDAGINMNHRNVGNYKEAIAEGAMTMQSMKKELIALNSQMANLTGEEYQAAAIKAGELKDKISDIRDDTKAMSGDTGFEKLGNTAGLLGDKLKNLDFKGAAEQAKNFQGIAQGMTFKEMIAGAGGFGSAMKALSITLLTNPIFALAMVITSIGLAWKLMADEAENANNVILDTLRIRDKVNQESADRAIALAKARGATEQELIALEINKLQATQDASLKIIGNIQKQKDAGEELSEDERKRNIEAMDAFDEAFNKEQILYEENEKIKDQIIADGVAKEEQEIDDYLDRVDAKQKEDAAKWKAHQEEKRKVQEENAKKAQDYINELNNKIVDLTKETLNKEIALMEDGVGKKRFVENLRYLEETANLKKGLIIKNDLSKQEIELNARTNHAIQVEEQTHADKLGDIDKDAAKEHADIVAKEVADAKIISDKDDEAEKMFLEKEAALRQSNKEAGIAAAVNATKEIADAVFAEKEMQIEREHQRNLEAVEANAETSLNTLQYQLDKGIISQSEFEIKKAALDKNTAAAKLAEDKKAFEANKKLKKKELAVTLAIELANIAAQAAANPLNAVTFGGAGLAQIAILAATSLAKYGVALGTINAQQFAKGGKVLPNGKINHLSNIETQSNGDNVLATVRSGEVILNERQQAMLGGHKTFAAMGVPGFANGGLIPNVSSSSMGFDSIAFAEIIVNGINNKQVFVSQQDIRSSINKAVSVEQIGKF
jgi:hypothetical protein